MLMFGKKKKTDAQKALDERGKGKEFQNKDETIVFKDDYVALVSTILDAEEGSNPHWVACSDLTKEGYTLVSREGNQFMFQKLPK